MSGSFLQEKPRVGSMLQLFMALIYQGLMRQNNWSRMGEHPQDNGYKQIDQIRERRRPVEILPKAA